MKRKRKEEEEADGRRERKRRLEAGFQFVRNNKESKKERSNLKPNKERSD